MDLRPQLRYLLIRCLQNFTKIIKYLPAKPQTWVPAGMLWDHSANVKHRPRFKGLPSPQGTQRMKTHRNTLRPSMCTSWFTLVYMCVLPLRVSFSFKKSLVKWTYGMTWTPRISSSHELSNCVIFFRLCSLHNDLQRCWACDKQARKPHGKRSCKGVNRLSKCL